MLEQMTRDLGLEKRVHFLGWSLHPETVFAQADLAVFPFRWQEPFGLVAAESAAQGLPVVAFRLGGVTESVIDGQTGFLAGEKKSHAVRGTDGPSARGFRTSETVRRCGKKSGCLQVFPREFPESNHTTDEKNIGQELKS
jgi:Glycosyltransferase